MKMPYVRVTITKRKGTMIITTVQHVIQAQDEYGDQIASVVSTKAFSDQQEPLADQWVTDHEKVYRREKNFFVTKVKIQ